MTNPQLACYQRRAFSDEEVKGGPSIHYDVVTPPAEDYADGRTSSAILRNKETGTVEEVNFTWSGYLPGARNKKQSVSGVITIKGGPKAYITFTLGEEGEYVRPNGAFVSFAGSSAGQETFRKMTYGNPYPAAFTARDVFH